MSCKCRICERHKRSHLAVKNKDVKEMKAIIEEYETLLENVETDVEHYELILNGYWPHSVEWLEGSLKNARLLRKQEKIRR